MKRPQFAMSAVADAVLEGHKPEVLDRVWAPDCALAIWHRQPDEGFQTWIDALPPESLPTARVSLRADQVRDMMRALCANHGIADDPNSKMLVGDVAALAHVFASVMKVDWLTLRLEAVNNDACRKFHQDNVAARLLCTYRGKGTEYGRCPSGGVPEEVHTLPCGSAGIFRGRQWAGSGSSVISHRSPPIGGSGDTRLILVIDPGEGQTVTLH